MMDKSVFYLETSTKSIKRLEITCDPKILSSHEKLNQLAKLKFALKPFFKDQVHCAGFGMFNVEFQHGLSTLKRAIVFGLTSTCNDIWEYNYDKQDWNWDSLFRYDRYRLTRYGHAQYKNNRVLLTGGREVANASYGVAYMEFNFNQQTQSVECSHIDTPSLNKTRMDHSCIIVNDYLFVLFGMKDDMMAAT